MEQYLKHLQYQFKRLPIGAQGIAWFISIKLSLSILKGAEEVPTYLFTILIQFILSIIILTLGLVLFDFISNHNRNSRN